MRPEDDHSNNNNDKNNHTDPRVRNCFSSSDTVERSSPNSGEREEDDEYPMFS